MTEKATHKPYDLENRTFEFAKHVRLFTKELKRSLSNREDAKQVIRSSGSVGANYIDANESLSKKDFVMRIKICRKEAKESAYWLRLIGDLNEDEVQQEAAILHKEANELKKIFSAIIQKTT